MFVYFRKDTALQMNSLESIATLACDKYVNVTDTEHCIELVFEINSLLRSLCWLVLLFSRLIETHK